MSKLTRQEYAIAALQLFNKCEFIVCTHLGLKPDSRFPKGRGKVVRDTALGMMNLPEEVLDNLLKQAKTGTLLELPEVSLPPKLKGRRRGRQGRQWGIHRDILHLPGVYSPEIVYALMGNRELMFDGYLVSMRSIRYRLFQIQPSCAHCRVVGTEYRLTPTPVEPGFTPRAHFNLWAIRQDKSKVALTKDHIVPISRGGPTRMENLQTLCADCNLKKGAEVSKALGRYLDLHEAWVSGGNRKALARDIEQAKGDLSPLELRAVQSFEEQRQARKSA